MADNEVFELELTGIAHGGSAVGRHEGRAIFVPYTIPDERVRARIVQDKGRFAHAESFAILQASPHRIAPRCQHFGRCGGCQWQHMTYAAQLDFKRQIVLDQMQRIGGFETVTVHPIIPSPTPWAYRSHVSLHSAPSGRLGFVATDGRTVLPIEECHIIRPELWDIWQKLADRHLKKGARLRLQVGGDADEHLIAVLAGDEDNPQVLSSADKIHYAVKGRTFQVSAGSFFQVNLPQAETLVNLALERLALTGDEQVLDLYSGVGLFTAFLAERARRVTTIESYPLAVQDAEVNLSDFTNVDIIEGAVEAVLPELDTVYEVALLDPPRAGMAAPALTALVECAPRKLVYVSCDPATLARDAKRLAAQGYRVLDVQPVDMFPQTYHIEAVAVFVRG
jgi:23S rRNA (uracil1939-C5)-methyltransferase